MKYVIFNKARKDFCKTNGNAYTSEISEAAFKDLVVAESLAANENRLVPDSHQVFPLAPLPDGSFEKPYDLKKALGEI
jgi:hypothetical protein